MRTQQIDSSDREIFNRYVRRRGRVSPFRKPGWWLAVLAVVVVSDAGLRYYHDHWSMADKPSSLPPEVARSLAPSRATTPGSRYPMPEALTQSTDFSPLPSLEDSDSAVFDLLAWVLGTKQLSSLFHGGEIVHRIVATIDNLPREKLPTQLLPLQPATGPLLTNRRPDGWFISPDNDRRYAAYVSLAEAIDAKRLVAAYVHLYPLLQEEYRALGYPSGAFNDRVVEAIDDLLESPETAGPIRVVQPKVMFEFADPDLEARSAGEKIMLRMGSANAARIKAKLRDIRRELTSPMDAAPAR